MHRKNLEDIDAQEKDVDERLVEQRIIHNIKRFIMTLGRDFTFVGNQYHLEIYGEEQKIGKIGNLLTKLRKKGIIYTDEKRLWHLSEN